MDKVLIIANRLQDRLNLISMLRSTYEIETWNQLPRSFQSFRELKIKGIILLVESKHHTEQFCSKFKTSGLPYWLCLYDKKHRLQHIADIEESMKVNGYWSGAVTDGFVGFLNKCCTGKFIFHKTEPRKKRFLDIMANRNRER